MILRPLDRTIMKTLVKRYADARREKARTGLYPLANLFFFITMRCNAKCDHCFCWQDLNVGIPELPLDQIERIADTCPPFRILCLTGGEPMLRRDLPEICRAFARNGAAQVIKVNTNGLFPEKVESLARDFKAEFPHTGMVFQLSLDGLAETHDRIRGVPGNFKRVIECGRRLAALQREVPLLDIEVLTIVNKLNYRELVDVNDFVLREISPTVNHGFELMRDVEKTAWNIPAEIKEDGVGPKETMQLPPVEVFPEIARSYKKILAKAHMRASPYFIHNLAQLRMVETGREQYKCVTAGQAVGVIYSNGDLTACEFTKPFANLADFDFDFDACWNSPAANERRQQIKVCHCIHGSFHGKAVEYSARGLLNVARAAVQTRNG